MGTFYHRICEAQLIAFDRLFIGIDIVIIGVQLYFTADILFDQFGIYLSNAVEISVLCRISAMGTQDHIIFYRIDSFVFCTKILIGA